MNKELELNIILTAKLDNRIKITSDLNNKSYNIIDCNNLNIFKFCINKNYIKEGNKLVKREFNRIKNNIKNNNIIVINYDKRINYFLNTFLYLIEVQNIKNIKMRNSYIYDKVCNELDRRFNSFNICNFEDNICCCKKCLIDKFDRNILIYGCCYTKGEVCKYLKNNKCSINCISCKLFTCRYLVKKKIKFKPSDFLLIDYYFNYREKKILENSLFTDKELILDKLKK